MSQAVQQIGESLLQSSPAAIQITTSSFSFWCRFLALKDAILAHSAMEAQELPYRTQMHHEYSNLPAGSLVPHGSFVQGQRCTCSLEPERDVLSLASWPMLQKLLFVSEADIIILQTDIACGAALQG